VASCAVQVNVRDVKSWTTCAGEGSCGVNVTQFSTVVFRAKEPYTFQTRSYRWMMDDGSSVKSTGEFEMEPSSQDGFSYFSGTFVPTRAGVNQIKIYESTVGMLPDDGVQIVLNVQPKACESLLYVLDAGGNCICHGVLTSMGCVAPSMLGNVAHPPIPTAIPFSDSLPLLIASTSFF
jgi:hypothetical protein